ncbi:hypothetical protein [Streptomyces sp. KL116D]|uniref:hypothetical protein n=1 Tax=Streptomyces sp. KL116D TaxID=3045152 RepID=UPI0035581A3A
MATHEVRDVHLLLTQPRARLLYAPPTRIVNPAFAVAEIGLAPLRFRRTVDLRLQQPTAAVRR